jgi:anti-anti-sigma regulatory factor
MGKQTEHDQVCQITCGEILDISSVGELCAELLTALESQQPVVLAAADIERADTTALQVFSAFFQDARAQGQQVQWQQPSEALRQSAALLGLQDLLALTTTEH